MSIVTERFMTAVTSIAEPSVILRFVFDGLFWVPFTLAVSEIADRIHRRAHAKRMQDAARRRPVRSEIAWSESPMTRLVREAEERKSA